MFGFDKNATLFDPPVDEEIAVGKVADFLFALHKEFAHYWIVTVRIIFCKVIEGNSSLQIERFGEKVIGEIKCISGDELRYVENVVGLIYFLIKESIVESEFPELDFFVGF